MKEEGVTLKIHNKNFNDGLLTSIDLTIEVPGKFNAHLGEEQDNPDDFEPLVFYYERKGKERIGFTRGIPTDISPRGEKIVKHKLVGIMIASEEGMRMSGTYNVNEN